MRNLMTMSVEKETFPYEHYVEFLHVLRGFVCVQGPDV